MGRLDFWVKPNALPARRDWVDKRNDRAKFCMLDAFAVPGVGVWSC